ncbi:phage head morphogenesis protein, partial [Enterococcus faecium]
CDVADMQPGSNAPNMHPFSRSSTAPYIERISSR